MPNNPFLAPIPPHRSPVLRGIVTLLLSDRRTKFLGRSVPVIRTKTTCPLAGKFLTRASLSRATFR